MTGNTFKYQDEKSNLYGILGCRIPEIPTELGWTICIMNIENEVVIPSTLFGNENRSYKYVCEAQYLLDKIAKENNLIGVW